MQHTGKQDVAHKGPGKAPAKASLSFWSMLKRGYVGTFHKISAKHLQK